MNSIPKRRQLKAHQLAWATSRGSSVDDKGYLENVVQNLFQPLSDGAFSQFKLARGGELKQKNKALHSSSALAVNVFHHWTALDTEERRPLAKALDLPVRHAEI